MSKLSEIEQAVTLLEAAQSEGQIPDNLRERISVLGGVRSGVKGALAAEPAEGSEPDEEGKSELSPSAEHLMGTLKSPSDSRSKAYDEIAEVNPVRILVVLFRELLRQEGMPLVNDPDGDRIVNDRFYPGR